MKKDTDYIFGFHPVTEALRNNKTLDKVLIQKGLRSDQLGEVLKLIKESDTPYQFVPVQKLNSITKKNHQGLIAFASPVDFYRIEQVVPQIFENGEVPLLLILDRVTDVRNFGAICRSAECAGVHAIIIPSRGSAQINSDAVKTSSGALLRIPVCKEVNLKKTLSFLADSGIRIIACHEKTEQLVYDCDLTTPVAILMGSEEDGISPEYLKLCHQAVKLPMKGEISSLNVSVASALVSYEVLRQRM